MRTCSVLTSKAFLPVVLERDECGHGLHTTFIFLVGNYEASVLSSLPSWEINNMLKRELTEPGMSSFLLRILRVYVTDFRLFHTYTLQYLHCAQWYSFATKMQSSLLLNSWGVCYSFFLE